MSKYEFLRNRFLREYFIASTPKFLFDGLNSAVSVYEEGNIKALRSYLVERSIFLCSKGDLNAVDEAEIYGLMIALGRLDEIGRYPELKELAKATPWGEFLLERIDLLSQASEKYLHKEYQQAVKNGEFRLVVVEQDKKVELDLRAKVGASAITQNVELSYA